MLFFSDLSSLSRLSAGGAGGPATLSAGPRWDRAPGERAGGRPDRGARGEGLSPRPRALASRPPARSGSRLPTLRRHSDGTLGGIHTHFLIHINITRGDPVHSTTQRRPASDKLVLDPPGQLLLAELKVVALGSVEV